jgi:single-strand DNA-binding protein
MNKWMGTGRLTRDTELRYTPNGTAVADISVCSNRVWSKDGEKIEEATFVDVTLWGKQAESLTEYLTKGTYVEIEGRLKLETWETSEGVKRSKLKVVADRVNLGPRSTSGARTPPVKENEKVSEEISEEVPF